ncbi:MAG: hypothetical protein E3J72_22780 [Planctomycetota bacterium]|nr:MAG: hypothetical protein E3J72_22780 [Planctomycetota bacterium]
MPSLSGIISIITDFGYDDVYVGQMKGVIAQIDPAATVIDLTHGVHPQDIVEGAFLLAGSWRFFPTGTVHVAVVDPGVGSRRKILAAEAGGHFFVAPDNGILELVFEYAERNSFRGSTPIEIVSVENPACRLPDLSVTFHGRDIMAPAAAHLTRGTDLTRLGPTVAGRVRLEIPRATFDSKTGITGEVVFVDHFGNLVTNISRVEIEKRLTSKSAKDIRFEIAEKNGTGLSRTYSDDKPGKLLALIGSMDLLEIAVNQGNAVEILDTGKGEKVRVY